MSQFPTFKDAVKDYLDKMAADDPVFAAKMANPDKSLDKCVEFVESEIFHKYIVAGNGRKVAVCEPSRQECFGLAVHYYDEGKIEIRKMDGVGSVATATPGVELSEEDKAKAREKAIERLAEEEARKIKAEEEKRRQKSKEKRQKEEESGVMFLFDE